VTTEYLLVKQKPSKDDVSTQESYQGSGKVGPWTHDGKKNDQSHTSYWSSLLHLPP